MSIANSTFISRRGKVHMPTKPLFEFKI